MIEAWAVAETLVRDPQIRVGIDLQDSDLPLSCGRGRDRRQRHRVIATEHPDQLVLGLDSAHLLPEPTVDGFAGRVDRSPVAGRDRCPRSRVLGEQRIGNVQHVDAALVRPPGLQVEEIDLMARSQDGGRPELSPAGIRRRRRERHRNDDEIGLSPTRRQSEDPGAWQRRRIRIETCHRR